MEETTDTTQYYFIMSGQWIPPDIGGWSLGTVAESIFFTPEDDSDARFQAVHDRFREKRGIDPGTPVVTLFYSPTPENNGD